VVPCLVRKGSFSVGSGLVLFGKAGSSQVPVEGAFAVLLPKKKLGFYNSLSPRWGDLKVNIVPSLGSVPKQIS
jgi:hypothetical protein